MATMPTMTVRFRIGNPSVPLWRARVLIFVARMLGVPLDVVASKVVWRDAFVPLVTCGACGRVHPPLTDEMRADDVYGRRN